VRHFTIYSSSIIDLEQDIEMGYCSKRYDHTSWASLESRAAARGGEQKKPLGFRMMIIGEAD
jgi:hypothetical protein